MLVSDSHVAKLIRKDMNVLDPSQKDTDPGLKKQTTSKERIPK